MTPDVIGCGFLPSPDEEPSFSSIDAEDEEMFSFFLKSYGD